MGDSLRNDSLRVIMEDSDRERLQPYLRPLSWSCQELRAMMGSARREPTAEPASKARRRLGFTQTPVLPILPSIDHSHCSSREESFFPSYLGSFFCYRPRFVGSAVTPYCPDNSCQFVGQGDRRL